MTMTRREAIAAVGAAGIGAGAVALDAQTTGKAVKTGRLKQSVARWCYEKIPLAQFCKGVAEIGLPAVDLLRPEEWAVAKDHGLAVSLGYAGAGTIAEGLNNPANHDMIEKAFATTLPLAAKAQVPNLIVFFGNRKGMSDAQGLDNCVVGLNRVKKMAEDAGVTILVELLNSKVNHKDYMGDRTPWGAEVMKRVASPRVKLLYDIYHMQIMEGDVIRTMGEYKDYIGHYHTGGVPGRHELDKTQELQWDAISNAIVATGFTGYMAHEFIPVRDPMTSLREAVVLCDV